MRGKRSLLTMGVLMITLVGSVASVQAQVPGDGCEYFAETGHYVCDEFREFYETRGGLEIFGYPLSEAFDDPVRGLWVQYFQRARMEWHPDNPVSYKVQLGLLVDELGYTFPPARPEQIPAFNGPIHHYFPETDHVVSYAFLEYFREKGGLDIFGYPRSEFLYENGYIVQYFQRARMEWHPEARPDAQMRLTNLGEVYVERFDVPEEHFRRSTINIDVPVSRLDARASVQNVVAGEQSLQAVFVYVDDQWQRPVRGAAVRIVVGYQAGAEAYECESANASGFARCSFRVHSPPPGRKVVVDVVVTYDGLMTTTQTFFLPWW